jgi:AraC-type DNA-binding domain-containing proteins
VSAKDVINNRLIEEAERRLITKNIPIKEIAQSLGFLNTSHFSAFLKKRTGLGPKQFREMS